MKIIIFLSFASVVIARRGVKKEQSICSLPKQAGLCDAYFPRFYFDKSTGECKRFIFGGCGGNANNFRTMDACQNACVCGENQGFNDCGTSCPLTCDNYNNPPETCNKMCNPGCHCNRGYVKSNDGKCVKPENCPVKSRVGTETEQSICSLPKEAGLCDAYFPRFYFDKSTGECKRFVYGGCGGNANNFRKMKDCQNACVCGKNQRYNECATSCPLTCDNYDNPPDTCTKMCNPGCHCEKGYVESNDGQCVKPENCPAEAGHP